MCTAVLYPHTGVAEEQEELKQATAVTREPVWVSDNDRGDN
jgi:hypothetical protein